MSRNALDACHTSLVVQKMHRVSADYRPRIRKSPTGHPCVHSG